MGLEMNGLKSYISPKAVVRKLQERYDGYFSCFIQKKIEKAGR